MHLKSPFDGMDYDLAGQFYSSPNYHQIQTRINRLVDGYITDKQLSDRLQDLPIQFENPQPRPWKPQILNWPAWSLTNQATFLFTFDRAMRRLWREMPV